MAYFNLGCNNDWERIMDLYFFLMLYEELLSILLDVRLTLLY